MNYTPEHAKSTDWGAPALEPEYKLTIESEEVGFECPVEAVEKAKDEFAVFEVALFSGEDVLFCDWFSADDGWEESIELFKQALDYNNIKHGE